MVNRTDVALRMLNVTDYPSFGYQITNSLEVSGLPVRYDIRFMTFCMVSLGTTTSPLLPCGKATMSQQCTNGWTRARGTITTVPPSTPSCGNFWPVLIRLMARRRLLWSSAGLRPHFGRCICLQARPPCRLHVDRSHAAGKLRQRRAYLRRPPNRPSSQQFSAQVLRNSRAR